MVTPSPRVRCAVRRIRYVTYYVRLTSLAIIELAPGSEYSVLVSDREWRNRTADCEPVEG